MLVMAVFMVGSMYLQAPWLYQEARFAPDLGRFGTAAPTVAGAAFGFGWTPCIGPVLASILAVAASSGRVTQGGTLLAVYSLGLGVPFLITGLLFGRMTGAFAAVTRHFTAIVTVSALMLGVVGTVLLFDKLPWLTAQLSDILRDVGLGRLVNLG
jgi:cytochrome c-type biogenesis protein